MNDLRSRSLNGLRTLPNGAFPALVYNERRRALITKKHYKNMAVTGYCVKCRDKAGREIRDAKEIEMKNGRRAMKGVCAVCGTGMFKILGNKK